MSNMENHDPLKELLPDDDKPSVKLQKRLTIKVPPVVYYILLIIWLILIISDCSAV